MPLDRPDSSPSQTHTDKRPFIHSLFKKRGLLLTFREYGDAHDIMGSGLLLTFVCAISGAEA